MNRLTLLGYHLGMSCSLRRVTRAVTLVATVAALAACPPNTFTPDEVPTNAKLYEASVHAAQRGNWNLASKGFEQLTFQLPARDPMLPQAYFHLGEAHQQLNEYILAAQAFSRIPENFPEDTLAGPATYQAGLSYAKLWKRPDLDADYGVTALSTFQSFLAAFPDSPLRDSAQLRIEHLNEMFAEKSLQTGKIYSKEGAYDSSIIYFKDVIAHYPQTKAAKSAMIGLVKAYRAISYREDAAETCATLHQKYPSDQDVVATCGKAAASGTAPAAPPAPSAAPTAKP